MVRECRASMVDPNSSAPSIEAIVHAVIPHRFVDHTHADAVLSLTNSPNAKQIINDVYGDRALVIPYVMPGFILAKTIQKKLKGADHKISVCINCLSWPYCYGPPTFSFSNRIKVRNKLITR